jgi:hypothetical protein
MSLSVSIEAFLAENHACTLTTLRPGGSHTTRITPKGSHRDRGDRSNRRSYRQLLFGS